MISQEPFAATYLWYEERTPRVRLVANPNYWDKDRGPHVREIVFRNDLSPEQALELVCTTEGEVDIVTEVPPAQGKRVEDSEHAKLVTIDPVRVIAGIINRDADDLPLGDVCVRQALNHAIDRNTLVKDAMLGYARPLAGLTPPAAIPALDRVMHPLFTPYTHDPNRAAGLWRDAGGSTSRPIRIAAPEKLEPVAQQIAADIRGALNVEVEVRLAGRDQQLEQRRRLAERSLPRDWDILIQEQGAQAADGPPMELHRAFAGADGEYRAGPFVPQLDAMYAELMGENNMMKQAEISHRIDELVYNEALALFLVAPQALYAVNRHVDFTPYTTTFELADSSVSNEHWSRRNNFGASG